jgi:hypothetical protein
MRNRGQVRISCENGARAAPFFFPDQQKRPGGKPGRAAGNPSFGDSVGKNVRESEAERSEKDDHLADMLYLA